MWPASLGSVDPLVWPPGARENFCKPSRGGMCQGLGKHVNWRGSFPSTGADCPSSDRRLPLQLKAEIWLKRYSLQDYTVMIRTYLIREGDTDWLFETKKNWVTQPSFIEPASQTKIRGLPCSLRLMPASPIGCPRIIRTYRFTRISSLWCNRCSSSFQTFLKYTSRVIDECCIVPRSGRDLVPSPVRLALG